MPGIQRRTADFYLPQSHVLLRCGYDAASGSRVASGDTDDVVFR